MLIQLLIRYLPNNTNVQLSNELNMNEVFKALNDPARREILKKLRLKDMTAGEIASKFDMTAPSISHHLDKLKRAGLVTTVKHGQFINYSINTTIIDDLLQYVLTLKN